MLYQDGELREQMSRNSHQLGVDKFDRRVTYTQVINLIKDMV